MLQYFKVINLLYFLLEYLVLFFSSFNKFLFYFSKFNLNHITFHARIFLCNIHNVSADVLSGLLQVLLIELGNLVKIRSVML